MVNEKPHDIIKTIIGLSIVCAMLVMMYRANNIKADNSTTSEVKIDSIIKEYKSKIASLNDTIKKNDSIHIAMVDSIRRSPPEVVKKIVLRYIKSEAPVDGVGTAASGNDAVNDTSAICYTKDQNDNIAIRLSECDAIEKNSKTYAEICANEKNMISDTCSVSVADKQEQIKILKSKNLLYGIAAVASGAAAIFTIIYAAFN